VAIGGQTLSQIGAYEPCPAGDQNPHEYLQGLAGYKGVNFALPWLTAGQVAGPSDAHRRKFAADFSQNYSPQIFIRQILTTIKPDRAVMNDIFIGIDIAISQHVADAMMLCKRGF
jgi:hypothetical protein